jgi:hypothetical protein
MIVEEFNPLFYIIFLLLPWRQKIDDREKHICKSQRAAARGSFLSATVAP